MKYIKLDSILFNFGKRNSRKTVSTITAITALTIGLAGTVFLWKAESAQDKQRLVEASQQKATSLSEHLNNRLMNIAQSLRRMASRMEHGAVLTQEQWRSDAKRHVKDFPEFKAVEWIDKSLHIRWIEPLAGNEKAIGLDLTFEGKRRAAVEKVVDHGDISMSQTISLVQGGQGFLIYAPIKPNGEFRGMVAGVCLTDRVVRNLPASVIDNYEFEIYDGDHLIYSTQPGTPLVGKMVTTAQSTPYEVPWTLKVAPSAARMQSERSVVPTLILLAGTSISFLVAFLILLIGKAKMAADAAKRGTVLLTNVFDNAPIGESLVSLEGKWLKVNPALCKLLGYSEGELLKLDFQTITHPEDLGLDLSNVQAMLDDEIQSYQMEKRYFHRKGLVVWVELNVSMARDENGKKLFFISQIQDITQRKQAEHDIAETNKLLAMQHQGLADANKQLQDLAATDGLTKLTNRRVMSDHLATLFSLRKRYGSQLSVIMLDVDHFKSVNDRFGHQVGDDVLVSVAQVAQGQAREGDMVARYGGEEFVIVCPQTTAADASILAERIRKSIEELDLPHGKVTASFGVAEQNDDQVTCLEIVSQADSALYKSKENGRNRVTIYTSLIEANAA